MVKSTQQPVVVIPNLNGGDDLLAAVKSLEAQSLKPYIIVVDNASTDGSVEKLVSNYPGVELIRHTVNEGYAGGVNPGFRRAIELGSKYVAPFNDDAVADSNWLAELVKVLDTNPRVGAAAAKVLTADGRRLDSSGDQYSVWGLPYPRGRGETDHGQYDDQTNIFAASGAASLYRVETLEAVGLLDEDFFAYYEDVDLGFRMQLAGWQVRFVPTSKVYHKIGMTSGRIKGFTTYQTMKNLPLLTYKNVPKPYLRLVQRRLGLAMSFFLVRAITRGQFRPALSGWWHGRRLIWRKRHERRQIQANKQVSDDYIWQFILHDLPPNSRALRRLRQAWWRLTLRGRNAS